MSTMDSAHAPRGGALGQGWSSFTVWRRSRPFWAGLWTAAAAVWLWYVPFFFSLMTRHTLNLSVAGIAGISTLAMTPMMLIMTLTIWFAPNYRVFAGVFTIICSLLAMVVSNFGGFVLGTLLGVIGGGLAFSWAPRLSAEQIAAHERAAQAYRAALAGDIPASAQAPLGVPAQAYGSVVADFAAAEHIEHSEDTEALPLPAQYTAAPAAPPKLVGTVAPTLPQNRQAPLADTLNQQRTASDFVPTATSPSAAPQDPDAVPPLPAAEDTPMGA